jgi:hypothetical protein
LRSRHLGRAEAWQETEDFGTAEILSAAGGSTDLLSWLPALLLVTPDLGDASQLRRDKYFGPPGGRVRWREFITLLGRTALFGYGSAREGLMGNKMLDVPLSETSVAGTCVHLQVCSPAFLQAYLA